jgi:hypothetical protein
LLQQKHNNKGDTTMIQVPNTDIDDYDLLGKEYEITVKNSIIFIFYEMAGNRDRVEFFIVIF